MSAGVVQPGSDPQRKIAGPADAAAAKRAAAEAALHLTPAKAD